MSGLHRETVLSVHHWTDRLFSFKTTRDSTLRFSNGHFTMIGLEVDGRPLMRAYSIASANHKEYLEFLSIKVENGPLTSRLQHIEPGDALIVGRKPTGTLLIDYLRPGRRLYLFGTGTGTGTGLAPFLSIIRDPNTYEKFDQVILVHGVREVRELTYHTYLSEDLPKDDLIGDLIASRLLYYPTVTRKLFHSQGRITALIVSGKLFADLGLPPLDASCDRVMLCGSPKMLVDLKTMLQEIGLEEGNTSTPGDFVIERAFVGK